MLRKLFNHAYAHSQFAQKSWTTVHRHRKRFARRTRSIRLRHATHGHVKSSKFKTLSQLLKESAKRLIRSRLYTVARSQEDPKIWRVGGCEAVGCLCRRAGVEEKSRGMQMAGLKSRGNRDYKRRAPTHACPTSCVWRIFLVAPEQRKKVTWKSYLAALGLGFMSKSGTISLPQAQPRTPSVDHKPLSLPTQAGLGDSKLNGPEDEKTGAKDAPAAPAPITEQTLSNMHGIVPTLQ